MQALENADKAVDYYALDLSLPELKRSLSAVGAEDYQHVKIRGLHGTYDDGLAWLKLSEHAGRPRLILSLGSSIGNFSRSDAASFLKRFSVVLGPDSKMLIGLDACQDSDRVYHGYNDREGKTREFYLNGLVHANMVIGKEAFRLEEWGVIGEYDKLEQRHQAFYTPLVNEFDSKKATSIRDLRAPIYGNALALQHRGRLRTARTTTVSVISDLPRSTTIP